MHEPRSELNVNDAPAQICGKTSCGKTIGRAKEHHAVMDASVMAHYPTAALLTVHPQVDTLAGQPLEIPGTSEAVPNIAMLCRAFREAERPIAHLVRLYLGDGSNAEPLRRALVSGPIPVLRPGSAGRLLAPGLTPDEVDDLDDDLLLSGGAQVLGPSEVVMYTPRWGAFFETRLDQHLRSAAVDTVVVGGCNFPNCPRASIYEASERDYRIVLVDDAVSGLYDIGRCEMQNIGVTVLSTAEVLCEVQRLTGNGMA